MNSRSAGFSLPEMLVVIVVGAIVLGAVYQTMAIQERANRQQMAIVTTEQNSRMALDVMLNELREASATDGDIYEATGTSIRFRALQKAGLVCYKEGSNDKAFVATLTNAPSFDNADSVRIFADNDRGNARDDGWITLYVNATPENNPGGCAMTGYTVRRVQFAGSMPLAAVDSGALVRSFKVVEYEIVDRGAGAVLERTEGDASPVAIADSLSSTGNGGLRFRYFDKAGTQIDPTTATLRSQIMRIEVKVRARAVGGNTGSGREFTDSLVNQIFLRGNYKNT